MTSAQLRMFLSSRTVWLVVLSGLSYGLLMGAAGSRLTFFAEDYDIFLNQSESGLEVLLLGNGGHWGPPSRLLVLIQTHLFGTWYPGYVAVNGFFLAAGLMAYATPIADSLDLSQWWARAAFMQIALVPGVMAVVLLASNGAWSLSFCLAGLAAVAATRSRWRTAIALVLASSLSMSGLGIFWALLAVGVSGAFVLARKREQLRSWRCFAAASIGMALGVVVLGRIASSVWDSPYFSQYGPEAGSAIVFPSVSLVNALGTWLIIVATWSFVSMWPAAMALVNDVLPRLAFTLVDYRVLAIGMWLAILVLLLLIARRVRSVKGMTILALVLAPALLWAAAIALLRSDQVHSDRYVFVWLPSLVAFAWTTVAATRSQHLAGTVVWGTRLLKALAFSSAVVLVLSLPSTLPMAANIDRPRWDLSQDQMARAQDCGPGKAVRGLAEVSPTPTEDYLCELTNYLDSIRLFK